MGNAAPEHMFLSLYRDTGEKTIEKFLLSQLPDRNYKIMTPESEESLLRSAHDASIILVCLDNLGIEDQNIAHVIREKSRSGCDIVGIFIEPTELSAIDWLSKGFDLILGFKECQKSLQFKKFLQRRLARGSARLARSLMEQDFRRIRSALSNAPVSVIIFDNDKRLTFASEHYYRAYPKSAPKLINGITSYDAFEMLCEEEGLDRESQLYLDLRQFWYNLTGELRFSMPKGPLLKLTATPLPQERGTIVTTFSLSDLLNEIQARP